MTCLCLYVVMWLVLKTCVAGLVAVVEPWLRRRPGAWQRIALATLLCLPPALLLSWWNVRNFAPGSDAQAAWFLLPSLLCLLHVDLCSFAFIIPDQDLAGAAPVGRAAR